LLLSMKMMKEIFFFFFFCGQGRFLLRVRFLEALLTVFWKRRRLPHFFSHSLFLTPEILFSCSSCFAPLFPLSAASFCRRNGASFRPRFLAKTCPFLADIECFFSFPRAVRSEDRRAQILSKGGNAREFGSLADQVLLVGSFPGCS